MILPYLLLYAYNPYTPQHPIEGKRASRETN